MLKKKVTKIIILFKQNCLVLAGLFFWFLIHFFVFYVISGLNYLDALIYTFYLDEMPNNLYSRFYGMISSFLIFGWLLTLVTKELYRKYHPEQTSLALSRAMRNHTVLIGYSNLGRRIGRYLQEKRKNFVVIENDLSLVNELIEAEEPVVSKKAHRMSVLNDASIRNARLVLSTKNDLETLVVATDLIREVNKDCKIVCRCFDDSLAQILEKNLGCETISTSKYASESIFEKIKTLKAEDVILIGCTNTTRRLMGILKANHIDYKIIEKNKEQVEDIIDEEPIIIGDAKDKDILEDAGVTTTDIVTILIDRSEETLLIADQIRELNKKCQLICRFFHEEVAEILEKEPFSAYVISTSKHTLEKLIENGVLPP